MIEPNRKESIERSAPFFLLYSTLSLYSIDHSIARSIPRPFTLSLTHSLYSIGLLYRSVFRSVRPSLPGSFRPRVGSYASRARVLSALVEGVCSASMRHYGRDCMRCCVPQTSRVSARIAGAPFRRETASRGELESPGGRLIDERTRWATSRAVLRLAQTHGRRPLP